MNKILKPKKLPDFLYSICSYFLPRLMFLQSEHAPQIHWGDIVIALHDFPADSLDLSSEIFWENWMVRWKKLGDEYHSRANYSNSKSNRKRFFRSASACYHWAEFMYFSNSGIKTDLRQKIKECFKKSLINDNLIIKSGVIEWNDVHIPYYLILPNVLATTNSFPCLIMSNGLDSVTELEIFSFAERFLESGIATFLFDGPGQGINLGHSPLEFQFEFPLKKIIEIVNREKSINSNSLGFFGVSFGGYLALRVAKYMGHLFKCVINLSGGPYLSPFNRMPRRLKEDFKYAFMIKNNEDMQPLFDKLSLDTFDNCQTEILSIHGELDDIFPIAGIKEVNNMMGKRHELIIYDSEAHVCLNYINQYTAKMTEWAKLKLFI